MTNKERIIQQQTENRHQRETNKQENTIDNKIIRIATTTLIH
jgi:hypothetical protein